MYKCTECGMEYETKPDYCDCGNDEFVLTVKKESIISEKEEKPQIVSESKDNQLKNEDIYQQKLNIPKVEPISLGIFLLCLIVSIIILLVPVKETNVTENPVKNITEESQNIPSIDKLWSDTVKVIEEEVKNIVPEQKPVQKETQNKQMTKSVVKTVVKQPQVKKPIQKQTTVIPVQKPAAPTVVQVKTPDEIAKKYEEVKKAAEDLQESMFAKQELAQYKSNLRNTIGKRIDFARVVGDGECAIAFSIDSSGKLINASFIQQSSNITLNDAVYKAFMLSRSYNPPPSGYKKETLTLRVKFYNGNFSITLG